MSPQSTDHTPDPTETAPTEPGLAAGRWEPCAIFTLEGGSSVCAECGWLDDDHGVGSQGPTAVIRRRPARRLATAA